MRIPHPRSGCVRVSELAAKKARESARSMGWSDRTIESLAPDTQQDGMVGVTSHLKYVWFQERGTKPFLMTWVEGRVVPMGCKKGDGPHFVRGSHVGEPGYVNIPHVGKVWRDQRWRHPGIKPKHFIQQAIEDAIREDKPSLKRDIMDLLRGMGRRGGQ